MHAFWVQTEPVLDTHKVHLLGVGGEAGAGRGRGPAVTGAYPKDTLLYLPVQLHSPHIPLP